jgi:hypothetical protein
VIKNKIKKKKRGGEKEREGEAIQHIIYSTKPLSIGVQIILK